MISKHEIFKIIKRQGFEAEQLSDVRWRLIHPKSANTLEMVYDPKENEFSVEFAVVTIKS